LSRDIGKTHIYGSILECDRRGKVARCTDDYMVSGLALRIENTGYGQRVSLELKLNTRLDDNSSASWDS